MNFTDIVSLVKREAKGDATDVEREWLNDPQNFTHWVAALKVAIQDAISQFSYQTARIERARKELENGLSAQDRYEAVRDEYDAWERKASRYRLGLEQRLAEIQAADDSKCNQILEAVKAHRVAQMALTSPTAADLGLWKVLDNH